MSNKWRVRRDPLFRGDGKESVRLPVAEADDSLVRHIMYFEGPGRDTPYLSTTEVLQNAEHFARDGSVWRVLVGDVTAESVGHISNHELLAALRGNGKGSAKWDRPFEVMQARRYVEQWSEHLLDFRGVKNVEAVVPRIFKRQ